MNPDNQNQPQALGQNPAPQQAYAQYPPEYQQAGPVPTQMPISQQPYENLSQPGTYQQTGPLQADPAMSYPFPAGEQTQQMPYQQPQPGYQAPYPQQGQQPQPNTGGQPAYDAPMQPMPMQPMPPPSYAPATAPPMPAQAPSIPMQAAPTQPAPIPQQPAMPSAATFAGESHQAAGGPQVPPPAAAPVRTNPNSTQNSLQIAEIRDGIVIMNDGSFRAVVMCKAINFDLMSPQEREAVEYSYQGLLNSLYFPVQIFIRSQKVDLGPYIEKLQKIRSEHENMLLALLMDDYVAFMNQLSTQTNIMDKKFYVIIPLFPTVEMTQVVGKATNASKNFLSAVFGQKDQAVVINEADLERAKTELRNRVQATLNGLQQASIQALPLDTQELIEMYYDAYNPDTATRQQLKNFDDLTAPVIGKGEGTAPQPQLDRELF